ncbi:hypothetical protein L873DRAFT_1099960 [Choiromyces venosus 120613-1]|uniref:Uncharacterized protein n=1 Tax=Choiromyces venosus 120613-1 TaxID=1336337 RepID=A0A3N4JLJ9_9PEZI|nr:hypothetical protein L873DRAFT_1099960 [Choiromyces venosus 120613-1]
MLESNPFKLRHGSQGQYQPVYNCPTLSLPNEMALEAGLPNFHKIGRKLRDPKDQQERCCANTTPTTNQHRTIGEQAAKRSETTISRKGQLSGTGMERVKRTHPAQRGRSIGNKGVRGLGISNHEGTGRDSRGDNSPCASMNCKARYQTTQHIRFTHAPDGELPEETENRYNRHRRKHRWPSLYQTNELQDLHEKSPIPSCIFFSCHRPS